MRVMAMLAVVVLSAMSYVWWGLRSPAPAEVPARGGKLENLILIEPGLGRRNGFDISFEQNLITSIEPADAAAVATAYALPGLIDMHVHQPVAVAGFEEYFSLLYLLHGVTTVRDVGYSYPDIFVRREEIAAGAFPGPRIFTCGTMLDGAPPLWEEAVVVATPAEAAPVVTRLASEGADCIKVYTNLRPDVLSAIRREAANVGLPVIGHIPATMAFDEARLDDVQHLIGVPDQTGFARDSNPFASGWDAMSAERIAFIADTSIAQGSAHTPTLVFLDYNSRRDWPEALRAISGADYLPAIFAEIFWQPEQSFRLGGQATPALYAQFRQGFEAAMETVRELHMRGVQLHAGTDTGNPFIVPGVSLQREIKLLVQAGLTPEAALAAATVTPGEFLQNGTLGRLQVGAPADILVFSEDPTVSPDALASLTHVVADGRVYTRAALEENVERYRQHFHNTVWDRIIPAVARLFD